MNANDDTQAFTCVVLCCVVLADSVINECGRLLGFVITVGVARELEPWPEHVC